MTLKELHRYCIQTIREHPHHEVEIGNLYELAVMEVEDGGSEAHECELAMNDIGELIKGYEE